MFLDKRFHMHLGISFVVFYILGHARADIDNITPEYSRLLDDTVKEAPKKVLHN